MGADQARALTINFSPTGSWLAAPGTDGFVRIVNADSGKVLLSHDQHMSPTFDFSNSVALSSDGKLIASAWGETGVELWKAASGKTVGRFEVPEQKQEMVSPSGEHYTFDVGIHPAIGPFSPDGSLLALVIAHHLTLFDVATGKRRLSLPLKEADGGPLPAKIPVVLAVDGDLAATADFARTIVLWDLKTGKQARQLDRQEGTVAALEISPDRKLLASCTGGWGFIGSRIIDDDYGDHTVQLWDLASGRRLLNITGHTDNVRSVAYFPDGLYFLSGGEDKTIRLWEVATGKQLFCRDIGGIVNQVAISPDGTKIAAVLDDGSVTCFPVDPPPQDKQPALDDKAFESLWADLAGDDGEKAYAAVRTLSQTYQGIVSRMSKRLHPTRSLAQMIADLDADDFERREAATKELAAAGPKAGAALRKALEANPSAEARSRIERILPSLDQWVVTDPDTLRDIRAIWVLERIGTPEARAILEDLAKGAPEVRQTQEAQAALDFLDKRAAAAKP
jgi:hypothetical protein